MEHFKLHHGKTFQANYLIPLIQDDLLERTIPDKPTSRLQKYRLTDKGSAWLAEGKSMNDIFPARGNFWPSPTRMVCFYSIMKRFNCNSCMDVMQNAKSYFLSRKAC
jgi:hypothetical protein